VAALSLLDDLPRKSRVVPCAALLVLRSARLWSSSRRSSVDPRSGRVRLSRRSARGVGGDNGRRSVHPALELGRRPTLRLQFLWPKRRTGQAAIEASRRTVDCAAVQPSGQTSPRVRRPAFGGNCEPSVLLFLGSNPEQLRGVGARVA